MGKIARNAVKEFRRSQKKQANARFVNLNSMLGNDWAMFYVICGGRMTGKSYSVTDFLVRQHRRHKENVKNYWLRISETSTTALLVNKANKLVDPDLQRKYNMVLTRKASEVYDHGRLFCTVLPLSGFAKSKGVAFFDKDFTGYYNIVLDEFQLEQGERKTSFDILYNFIGMLENIARTTKNRVRVFLLGNTLEEASTILKAFNFLPEKFGRFYLRSKRCVIDNLEPTEEYLKDRQGSLADILGGGDMSNYTNELSKDRRFITKDRPHIPTAIIKFGKQQKSWYVLYDGKLIRRYKGEKVNYSIPMRPYLSDVFNKEKKQSIIDMYDANALLYNNLIDQSYFTEELSRVRKA